MKSRNWILIALIVLGAFFLNGTMFFSLLDWGTLVCTIPSGGGSCSYEYTLGEGKEFTDLSLELAGDYVESNPKFISVTNPIYLREYVSSKPSYGQSAKTRYFSIGLPVESREIINVTLLGHLQAPQSVSCEGIWSDQSTSAQNSINFGSNVITSSCSSENYASSPAKCNGVFYLGTTVVPSGSALSECKYGVPYDFDFNSTFTTATASDGKEYLEFSTYQRTKEGCIGMIEDPVISISDAYMIFKEFPSKIEMFYSNNILGNYTGTFDGTMNNTFETPDFASLANSICKRPTYGDACKLTFTFTSKTGGGLYLKVVDNNKLMDAGWKLQQTTNVSVPSEVVPTAVISSAVVPVQSDRTTFNKLMIILSMVSLFSFFVLRGGFRRGKYSLSNVRNFLRVNKEGTFIGIALALIITYAYYNTSFLTFLKPLYSFLQLKILNYVVLTTFGALLGGFLDSVIIPNR